MLVYRIIAVICIIIFVAMIILLITLKLLRNEYNFTYVQDELVSMNKISRKKADFLFQPDDVTSQYINKYIISKRRKRKKLMIEYNRVDFPIEYEVICYKKGRRISSVLRIKDKNPKKYSKLIKLPRYTKSLNIVITKVSNESYNESVIKPVKKFKILLFSLISALAAYSLALGIYEIYFEISKSEFKKTYLDWYFKNDIISFSLIFIIVFIISLVVLNIKRSIVKNGRR